MDKGDARDDSMDRDNETISSSRSMPVPVHLTRGRDRHPSDNDGDTAPPPSYEEAIRSTHHDIPEGAQGGTADEAAKTDEEGLSPEEIALVLRMQSKRDDYLPERRGSYEEAMEMIQPEEPEVPKYVSPDGNDVTAATNMDTMAPLSGRPTLDTMESGRAPAREQFECHSCGYLNQPITSIVRYLKAQSEMRLIFIGVLVFCVLGLVLFVSLFPASFVYIDYYQVALPQSKLTGKVDRETVYYSGCYVLGPDTTLVRFQSSAHVINIEMGLFTLDTLSITVRYSLVYFLRPKEVGQLYTKFLKDYDDVFKLIVKSSLRNQAATSFYVDNFRFNRTYVEREMHSMLRKRLGGDCCPECCPKGCQSNTYCETCKAGNCDPGYHIDVRYFNLLSVTIPTAVFERYLQFTILEIEKEKEFFLQDYALIHKETTRLTDGLKNEAEEIRQNGTSQARKITTVSEAQREKTVTTAYTEALQGMFMALKVAKQDYKNSIMMIRALEESIDNIYTGYGYNTSILFPQ